MTNWGKDKLMTVHEQDPFNAEAPGGSLATLDTAASAFYSRNHGPIPDLDPSTFVLTVDGLVGTPLALSMRRLRAEFDVVTERATLQCAGNRRADLLAVADIPGEDPWGPGAISTATWTGVRLADVLAAAGVTPEAAHVEFLAPDVSQIADPPAPYGSSIALQKALAEEVLLAWAMNGAPLPRIHGAPLRAVVPGWVGARSVKWLQRIHVRAGPSENYFQRTAYRILPPEGHPAPGEGFPLSSLSLSSAILTPDSGTVLPSGTTQVTGYALAGDDRNIARVDVSGDGGRIWVQANLAEDPGPWTWRHWEAEVVVAPDCRELLARAWDTTGLLQPENPASVWNPKGYNNTSWARQPIQVSAATPS